MMIVLAATLASALMPPDLPEAERLKLVAPFFESRPGELLRLDPTELRDMGRRAPPGSLRGYLTVTPPPGRCLTITRGPDRPDVRICTKKRLAFTLNDLDRAGRIAYQVVTGDGDFGTDVTWPTPYRLAITTPFDRTELDPPVYKFVAACEATKGPGKRRIRIDLIGGETWIVNFPDQDKLEPQPKPIPNLFLHVTGGKVSVKDAAKQKELEAAAKTEAEADGRDSAPAAKEPAAAKAEGEEHDVDQNEDRSIWSIPARDAYTLAGQAFMPHGSVTPGGNGRCRYHYAGSLEDPQTGRLECRDVDGFRHVLVPLTCLRDLH